MVPEQESLEPAEALSLKIHSGREAVDQRLNVNQMLMLIDSILPFEACLFYQVIPLSIEAGHLNLGMVNPSDLAAVDYVRRQVAYINFSVVSWPIDSDWHRQVLSRYLSYAAKKNGRSHPIASVQAPALDGGLPHDEMNEADERLTFIVDSPEQITIAPLGNQGRSPQAAAETSSLAPGAGPTDGGPVLSVAPLALNLDESLQGQTLGDLRHLSPPLLMQALLYRVLQEGIGRLYFERLAGSGRVLCSQDGVLQSVVEDLDLALFQGVINELKRLVHLPLLPTTTTKQVDIERLYRQERLLLRLRLMAGSHGEEATLQVLRGAALRFYQQQQIEQLGRDALTMAHSLQQRLHAIREQARQDLALDPVPTATLLAVSQLLKEMEAQIGALLKSKGDRPPPSTNAQ